LPKSKKHLKRLKRDKKKKKDKRVIHDQQQKLDKQMNMFDRLPSSCSACKKEFPKTRDAHMTWQVVVRTEQELVRLFCPGCQELASNLAEEQNEV
jgi:hypothetical protein